MAMRLSVPSGPGAASEPSAQRWSTSHGAPERDRTADGLSPAAGNRALARAVADRATPGTPTRAQAAATRTLARCPGCGGRCGGTCGHGRREPDEELLDSGQRALRRAVMARRALGLNPKS